jgi:cyanophycin synthetase
MPIVVVVGAKDSRAVATQLSASLLAAGLRPGWSDPSGVTINGEQVAIGPMSGFVAGLALTLDKGVNAAVVCLNDTSVLRKGLPFDRYDMLVLAGGSITMFAGEADESPAVIMTSLIDALLPACRGMIFNLAGSGVDFDASGKGLDASRFVAGLEPARLAQTIVSTLGDMQAGQTRQQSEL